MDHDEQIAKWIQEQYEVASQVIVRPDPNPLPLFLPSCLAEECSSANYFNIHSTTTGSTTSNHPRFVNIGVKRNDNIRIETNIVINRQDQEDDTIISYYCYYYGGVDVSFPVESSSSSSSSSSQCNSPSSKDDAVAVYVILEFPSMITVYQQYIYFPLTIPYIPSFLAFREMDPIIYLIQQQQITHPQYTPNVIFVDGNGIFHIRNAGLACFIGIRTNIPTIGIGKTLYCHPESGRTKENIHHMIYHSIRSYCDGDGVTSSCNDSDDNDDNNDNGGDQHLQDTKLGQQRETTVLTHHSSELNVTFDCCGGYVDLSSTQQLPAIDHHRHHHNDDKTPRSSMERNDESFYPISLEDRTRLMKQLSQKCIGLAIPIYGSIPKCIPMHHTKRNIDSDMDDNNDDPTQPYVLAFALVGHGGGGGCRRRRPNKGSTQHCASRQPGTVNPIYISVGHNISLQEAVLISCELSLLSRIPEPVRQADLYGRALLREKEKVKEGEARKII